MPESPGASRWTRHVLYRAERTRTTWKLRIAVLALLLVGTSLTRGWWTVAVARSLVCESDAEASEAILVENFNLDYYVFERAADLRRSGVSTRVLVPVVVEHDGSVPNDVAVGTAELLARASRLGPIELVPVRELEPISLNAARDLLPALRREGIRSIVIVAPLFRSRRSALVYGAVLGRAGITVRCEPARSSHGVTTWTHSWHGIQDGVEQWLKLQYYRIWVLPFGWRWL